MDTPLGCLSYCVKVAVFALFCIVDHLYFFVDADMLEAVTDYRLQINDCVTENYCYHEVARTRRKCGFTDSFCYSNLNFFGDNGGL